MAYADQIAPPAMEALIDDLRSAADSWAENINYGRPPPYLSKENTLLWRAADEIIRLRKVIADNCYGDV
jgi:plasmid stabilization system protein ParE